MKTVKIVWEDSKSTRGWGPVENDGPAIIQSCGYLAKETKDFVVITTSFSQNGNVMDQLCIPKSCIKSIKKFRS